MPLQFDYTHDWRLHSVVWRRHGGMPELSSQAQRQQIILMVWIAVLLFSAILALQTRTWLFFVLVIGMAAWKATQLFALRGLAMRAAWGMRGLLREKPRKRIRLVVTDEGMREFDGDVESFVAWPGVKSFYVYRRVVGIELGNGLMAYVPAFTLSDDSASIDDLVASLEAHGIPRSTYQPRSPE